MKNKGLWADLGLVMVALIWGWGYTATEYAIASGLSSAMILLLRFAIAASAMGAASWQQVRTLTKQEWMYGGISGVFLFLAFMTQLEGQSRTTPSNCAFITITNVLMVPFIVWAVSRKRPGLKNLLLPVLSVAGCMILGYTKEGIVFTAGDLLVLAGAFLFACHIASLEFTSQKVNAQKLTFIKMAVASVMALGYALVTNAATVTMEMLRTGALPVLYLGLFSTCICFFLQTWAQKHTSATKAAIFLSLEGVFGALFSVILGLETMRWTLAVGGSLIFASVLLTEVRFGKAAK